MLLMGGFEDVIGNVAGLSHAEIAMVHGLGENHRHQAVIIGDLLGVARLQGCHVGQKAAPLIHKAEDVGDGMRLDFGVEAFLKCFVLVGFGPVPG